MSDWWGAVVDGDAVVASPPITVIFSLLLAFVLGQIIGWVYVWTHSTPSYSRSYVVSIVVLPVIVCLMMLLVAGSFAVAFGLLAVFAVVRFRNVLKDTRDTTYILWAIVEGMAAGTNRYSTAVIGAAAVSCVFLYLWVSAFGTRQRYDAVLSIEILGNLQAGLDQLEGILRHHASYLLQAHERRVTSTGATVSYRLLLRDPSRDEELRHELSTAQDLRLISLYRCDEEAEL
jgi:hypothetical protein